MDPERGPQAYYQTGFPAQDVSGALEEILRSVLRIHVEGSYERYVFSETDPPTEGEIGTRDLRPRAVDTVFSDDPRAATAVVIAASSQAVTLLSTDHAINFPDTVVEYFGPPGASPGGGRSVESLSLKTRQTNAVVSSSRVETFEILARSPAEDLALLGVRLEGERAADDLPPLEMASGDPRRLSWGSFVYVLGHPGGFPMVTRGIVSEPNRGPPGAFLIDGLWNEGMSGAPIFAVRGASGQLEWVGVARAASARTEYRLAPEEGAERTQDLRRPYEGATYLEAVQEIRYGISFSIPVTTARRFVQDHRDLLTERGYPVPAF